jgi:hypothetical protein
MHRALQLPVIHHAAFNKNSCQNVVHNAVRFFKDAKFASWRVMADGVPAFFPR